MSIVSFLLNKMFTAGDKKRDEGYVFPENVDRFEGIVYGKDEVWNSLDVYAPKEAKNLPVIVSVHGGGYAYGGRNEYRPYGLELSRRGFVVVNFSYHLAPKSKYPTQLEETNQVSHWVKEHIAEYGGDISKLFLVGDSAGAQLSSQYLAILTNPEYAKNFDFALPDIAVKGVGLNFGVFDVSSTSAFGSNALMRSLRRDYLGKNNENDHLLAVPNFILPSFPPAFVMTGEYDPLKTESFLIEKKLLEVGVPHVFRCYSDGEDKRYTHVFHLNAKFAASHSSNDEQCDFFKELCG